MKINKYNNMISNINQSKQVKSDSENKVAKEAVKEKDQVNISKEAQALLDADKAAFSDRVDSIKEAIQNGEYEVDASKISQGLIKTLQEQKEL